MGGANSKSGPEAQSTPESKVSTENDPAPREIEVHSKVLRSGPYDRSNARVLKR